ncbi:signal peptidase I [Patescibacteria group bacterium]|nr:signal peptidase I [Patescibacteria group bacterium]
MEKTKTKKSKIKIIQSIINLLLLFLLAVTALVLVLATIETPLGIKVFNVTSGSMEPNIKMGTLVFVKPADEYQIGDVITFYPKFFTKETVTHRIFNITTDEETNTTRFTTKGDANESEDMNTIPKELILGKVVFKLPLIGHVLAFTKTQMGFITLIVVPATIIIYSEVMSIKNEVMSFLAEKKEKKSLNNLEKEGKKEKIKKEPIKTTIKTAKKEEETKDAKI